MAMTDYLNDMPAQGNRKVVLVGTGFVGMSMAYTLMNHKGIDELVLVDVNTEKAEGEAMDLNHGGALVPPIKVTSPIKPYIRILITRIILLACFIDSLTLV